MRETGLRNPSVDEMMLSSGSLVSVWPESRRSGSLGILVQIGNGARVSHVI